MTEVEGLSKRRGGRAVVADVTFRCEPGTVTGFLGPDGAGKSLRIRGLLREFADRGGTVLLSSHPLAELEADADRLMLLGAGQVRAQCTRAELLNDSGTIVEADDLATLEAVLDSAGLSTRPADGDRRLVDAEPEVVARLAMANDVVLRRLAPAENACLERLFIELTTAGGDAPSPKPDLVPAKPGRAAA